MLHGVKLSSWLVGVQMIGDLGVTSDPKKVGYYSGLVVRRYCAISLNEGH